jgi:tRNA(Ile2) C34 agmatinyltransferase TiaS
MANDPAKARLRLTAVEFERACQTARIAHESRARRAAFRVLVCGGGVSRAAADLGIDKAGVSRMLKKIVAAHSECPTCGRGFGGNSA